ncbi:hypothetical protein CC79DRAFT_1320358 [Sarocladium strictum]
MGSSSVLSAMCFRLLGLLMLVLTELMLVSDHQCSAIIVLSVRPRMHTVLVSTPGTNPSAMPGRTSRIVSTPRIRKPLPIGHLNRVSYMVGMVPVVRKITPITELTLRIAFGFKF